MARSRRKLLKSAFTLIELLTVISIVAVLAALLFPVLASAKNAGYKAAATSNLRQIYNACTLYSNDYDHRIPYAVSDNVWRLAQTGWDDDFARLILSDHVPPFSVALKPYGCKPELFEIKAGNGPAFFREHGTDYFYPVNVSANPVQRYEEEGCPYFYEYRPFFHNGGFGRVAHVDDRVLNLRFTGQVRFELQEGLYKEGEACARLYPDRGGVPYPVGSIQRFVPK